MTTSNSDVSTSWLLKSLQMRGGFNVDWNGCAFCGAAFANYTGHYTGQSCGDIGSRIWWKPHNLGTDHTPFKSKKCFPCVSMIMSDISYEMRSEFLVLPKNIGEISDLPPVVRRVLTTDMKINFEGTHVSLGGAWAHIAVAISGPWVASECRNNNNNNNDDSA